MKTNPFEIGAAPAATSGTNDPATIRELLSYSGEDYYVMLRPGTVAVKESSRMVFRFGLSPGVRSEIEATVKEHLHDKGKPAELPFSARVGGERVRMKVTMADGKLSMVNFRRYAEVYDFGAVYFRHKLLSGYLRQLFLKGKTFVISGETGSGKTSFAVALMKYLNEASVEKIVSEWRRRTLRIFLGNDFEAEKSIESSTDEEVATRLESLLAERNSKTKDKITVEDIDNGTLRHPLVEVLSHMKDSFIFCLENPVEHEFVNESKNLVFEQIETDDYSAHLVEAVSVNPNLVYVSESRTKEDYENLLLISAQGKQSMTTNHSESTFDNVQKMVSYIGNRDRVIQDILSGVGGFLHFKRYYPDGMFFFDGNVPKFMAFGETSVEKWGRTLRKRDGAFITSYECLSLVDDDVKMLLQNEKDIQNFRVRVKNSHFYVPHDGANDEQGKQLPAYVPHEVSLLYRMLQVYMERGGIPNVNLFGMKFSQTVMDTFKLSFLFTAAEERNLQDFLERMRILYPKQFS